MPYVMLISQAPLDAETVTEVLEDGALYSGVSIPRTLARFSELSKVLQGRGVDPDGADKLTKIAARTLRKDDEWLSPDGRVVVRKVW